MNQDSHRITRLLGDWSQGNDAVAEELLQLVYPTLRQIAARHMAREQGEHTLQPTALVNEAYLRLVGPEAGGYRDRAHFFRLAARLMRNVLVDHARRQQAQKRGGGAVIVAWIDQVGGKIGRSVEVMDLDRALEHLGRMDPRAERIVELKFFSGLTIDEIAELEVISPATVKRDWAAARAFLYQQLTS